MNTRIGKPTAIGQHVIVDIVKNINREGFDSQGDFSIQDINPNNTPGQPKYHVLIEGYVFPETFPKQIVNNFLFEKSLRNLLTFLAEKKKEGKEIKVALQSQPKLDTEYLTVLYLIDKAFPDITLSIFFESVKEAKMYDSVGDAILNVKKVLKTENINCIKNLYSLDMFDIYEDSILKRTKYDFKKDLSGKRVAIIDTHNFYYRNFFGMPSMYNSSGTPTSVLKALTTSLKSWIEDKYDYIIFASEDKRGVKNGVRYALYEQYKANREETDEELKVQIKLAEELLTDMGFKIVSEEGFEADDIVGSYSRFFESMGAEVIIHTTDKDMYQLISDKVKIWNPMKQIFITEVECREKFIVGPEKVVYSLALGGDTSDNVPGVKGIGPKKAAALIQQYGDLNGIYKNVDTITGAVQKNLQENQENAFLSLELVTIYDFLARDVKVKDFKFPNYNIFSAVKDKLEELEINV